MPSVKPVHPGKENFDTAKWVCYCDLCGERFKREKRAIDDSNGCFCSQKCRAEYKQNEETSWHCVKCGNRLRGEDVFCSDECAEWARSWHENYPVGKSEYKFKTHPTNDGLPFNNSLWGTRREEAIKRDGRECKRCGITAREHREKFGSGLIVHHVTPRREFDTAEEAHDLENLVTLCSKCHGEVENGNGKLVLLSQ